MDYIELLEANAKKAGHILCMGIDPVKEKIPDGNIVKFYFDIFDRIEQEGLFIPSYKPNIAFFEQYGSEGHQALEQIIARIKNMGSSVILDAKRGDIGKTAKAYSKAIFGIWGADATTLAPYLGSDSVKEFIIEGKGAYLLTRTSNASAVELQNLQVDGTPLYKKVAELIVRWDSPGLGAVVGATYLKELEELSGFFVSSGVYVPMLIPGVGAQGGTAEEVMEVLRQTNNPLWLHRVNSSSGISFAYLKKDTDDYAGAAVEEIKNLIEKLRL